MNKKNEHVAIDILQRAVKVAQTIDEVGVGLTPLERAIVVGIALEAFAVATLASAPPGLESDARDALEAGIALGRNTTLEIHAQRTAEAVTAQALGRAKGEA